MKTETTSPNEALDKAIKKLIQKLDSKDEKEQIPPDTAVKILAMAINWEKVKHHIVARESEFDPDEL